MTTTQILSCALLAGLAAGCAFEPDPAAAPTTSTVRSALTTDDVDFAEECTGILTYAQFATFVELDSILPSNVANAIVAARAVAPFNSIADISAVSGVGEARLEAIARRANELDFTDVGCMGIVDELALSFDDAAAIVGYANVVDPATLRTVVRADPDSTVANIVAARPFTTVQQVGNVSGVGPSTFRSLRNAAIDSPIDDLITKVNAAHQDVTLSLNFDWFAVLFQQPGRPASISCFGVDPDLVAEVNGILRPDLAGDNEVMAQVGSMVSLANRTGAIGDATAGLDDLRRQVTNQSFFGCYLDFRPDPFSGIDRAFYVNTATSYRVFTELRWSE